MFCLFYVKKYNKGGCERLAYGPSTNQKKSYILVINLINQKKSLHRSETIWPFCEPDIPQYVITYNFSDHETQGNTFFFVITYRLLEDVSNNGYSCRGANSPELSPLILRVRCIRLLCIGCILCTDNWVWK